MVSWLALAAFAVGSVGSALLGQTVFMSTQTIESMDPWAALDPGPTRTPQTNQWLGDTLDAVTPGMLLHQRSLDRGEFAQWDPYVAGGAAGASIPDDATFSPLSLPWYVLPGTAAPGAVKILEIATVTLGMSLLLRRFRLPSAAWALSSLVYSSSAFMVAWTNWPQTRVAALIPLLFWAVDKVATERRAGGVLALAAVVASMLAGGFPAVTGFALYAAGAYAVVRALAEERTLRALSGAAVRLVAGLVAGAGLMAWQLLPFAHQALNVVDFSVRQQTPSRHLEWEALATIVVPEIFGGPVGAFWGIHRNPVETFSYVGAATFALLLTAVALLAPARKTRLLNRFSLIALGVCVVLVYIGGPPLALFQHLPVFSNNAIGRLTVLVGFFSAVIAGVAFAAVLAPRTSPAPVVDADLVEERATTPSSLWSGHGVRRRLAVAAALLTIAAITVRDAAATVPPEQWPHIESALARAGAFFAITAVLVVVAQVVRRGRLVTTSIIGLIVPLLILWPALGVTSVWWPKGPPEYFYPTTPSHDFLAANLGHDRYMTVDWTMFPGTSSAYELRAANGHTFHTVEWKDLLRAADPDVMTTPTFSTLKGDNLEQALASPVLDRLAVRFVALSPRSKLPGNLEVIRRSTERVLLAEGEVARAHVTGPLRGVIFTLPDGMDIGPTGASITLEVTSSDGTEVARARHAFSSPYPPAQIWLPLSAGSVPLDEPLEIEVSVVGADHPVAFAGDSRADVALEVVRPASDNLRVAHTGDATVLERLSVMDRIRWAGRELVHEDPDAAVRRLASVGLDRETVVLQDPDDAIGAAGSTAVVDVLHDGADVIEVAVDASDDGWLVVADSFRGGGWSAYLDGGEVRLVDADHAMAAVAVPPGRHTVRLVYDAPGLRAGMAVALVTLMSLTAMVVAPLVVRRSRTAPDTSDETTPT